MLNSIIKLKEQQIEEKLRKYLFRKMIYKFRKIKVKLKTKIHYKNKVKFKLNN